MSSPDRATPRQMTSRLAVAPGTPADRVWAVLIDLRLMTRLHRQVFEARSLDGPDGVVVAQTWVVDTRLGAAPPVAEALAVSAA